MLKFSGRVHMPLIIKRYRPLCVRSFDIYRCISGVSREAIFLMRQCLFIQLVLAVSERERELALSCRDNMFLKP
jgi:hypothetical protein